MFCHWCWDGGDVGVCGIVGIDWTTQERSNKISGKIFVGGKNPGNIFGQSKRFREIFFLRLKNFRKMVFQKNPYT